MVKFCQPSHEFHEPQGLPPQCRLCHRIRLKAGISAVVVPPYRYTHLQKDELERQCDVMLRTGVIRHSTSAFYSLVLLEGRLMAFLCKLHSSQCRARQRQVPDTGGQGIVG
jgi:hypothetical protein